MLKKKMCQWIQCVSVRIRTDRFIIVLNGYKILFNYFLSLVLKNICTPVSEISVQCKYMLRVNIRTPLKVIFGTKNIIGGMFRLLTQYISQLLTVLNQQEAQRATVAHLSTMNARKVLEWIIN